MNVSEKTWFQTKKLRPLGRGSSCLAIRKLNYGDDNCEHYSYQGWKIMLRIIDDC